MKIFDTKRLRVRKLTPYEYGTLQAFPMETWEQVVSDSQAYKQFGNAVTVTLFEAIAINIKNAILAAEESEELNMEAAEVSKEFGMNPPTEEENKEETVETEVLEVETETGIKAAVVKTGEKEHQAAAVEEKPGNIEAYDLAKFAMNCLFDNGIIARACFTTENTQMLEKCIEENLDGVTIGKEPKDARDWEAARRALDDIINKYDPSGYMAKAIFPVLMPLKERLDHGERTPELFNQIVESTR